MKIQPIFPNVAAWIANMRLLVEADQDNVLLFDGSPGNGKSTLMVQLGRQLDPDYSLDHIHFELAPYVDDARTLPPRRVIHGDEWLMSARRSMSEANIEVGDFFQINRGLNLHHLIAYPESTRLDKAIRERVRYRVTVQDPQSVDQDFRIAIAYERKTHRILAGGEERVLLGWRQATPPFRFYRNKGPFWEAYLAKKLLAARRRNAKARGESIDQEVDRESDEAGWPRNIRNPKGRMGRKIMFRIRPTSPLAALISPSDPPPNPTPS